MKHPLPGPTLFERTCAVVAIGAAMLAVALLAGCGKSAPTGIDRACLTVAQVSPVLNAAGDTVGRVTVYTRRCT